MDYSLEQHLTFMKQLMDHPDVTILDRSVCLLIIRICEKIDKLEKLLEEKNET